MSNCLHDSFLTHCIHNFIVLAANYLPFKSKFVQLYFLIVLSDRLVLVVTKLLTNSYLPPSSLQAPGLPVAREAPPTATLLQRMGTRDEGLDDLEEEKKGIVHREIDKFRETMKIREAEKEEQDKKKDSGKTDKESSRRKSKSRERDSESRSRESRGREGREERRDRGSSARERPRRSRSPKERRSAVSRSRSRSPPARFPRQEPRMSRERDTRTAKEIQKDREMEEEEKENKRAERKAIEKEAIYQVNGFSDKLFKLYSFQMSTT